MAIPFKNDDLTHIVRTTEQWKTTADKYEIIPEGVLCVEFTPSDKTNIKIGNGHKTFRELPYVAGSIDLSLYYTREETDNRILSILNEQKVFRIKGYKKSFNELPANGAEGDVWFVESTSPSEFNIYEKYIWTANNKWEFIGNSNIDIDLSQYAKKEDVENKFNDINLKLQEWVDTEKVHTHLNKEILDKTDAIFDKVKDDKLSSLTNYDDKEIRSKITDLEKTAHTHQNKDTLDKTTAPFTIEYERLMPFIREYVGASRFEDGEMGLVPPALAGEQDYILTGAGKWVPNTGGGVYELPIATKTELGGVIIGDGINVDENGVISVDASATIDLKTGDGLEIVDVVNPEHTKLPNGYGEISYLESLNGQYTIIDYVPNENTRVVCEFSYQESNVGDQCLFGTRTGNTSGSRQFVLWMEWDSSKPYTGFVYGGNNWGGADVPSDGYTLTCEIGQKMVADVSVNGYYLDNTLIHTVTNTGSPSAYKLAIFHLSNSNTTVESNKTAFKGRIYSFKIYENDVLVANLIPAIVMALNIPGFYDVINNKFYQSSTSNSFTYDASSVIIDSAEKQINLLPATTTDIGGIIVGDGLSITEDGILSISGEISDETYRAGLGINIEEKPIPGDIELDILNNEYAGWDNFTYLWTGGAEYEETNYVLHTTRDRIADEEGNWLTHFKIPDGVENIKVEAVAKDGTPLKFWIDNHDSETLYRWSLLGRWYDSGETIIYPDEYVPSLLKYNYISIGLCFDTNNTRTISVNDIDYVKLYFIEGDPENPKGMGKYINSDIASEYQLGGVIIGKGINVTEDGVISVDSMPLEPATSETLGGIKVGSGLEITKDGKLNVIGGGGTGSDCVTDVDLKQDAPGVIVVTKPNETKELDVFQYMTELEINCVEDATI